MFGQGNEDNGAFQVAVVVENLPANAGNVRDAGLIPGLGRSSGGRHGHPLQYSCLENPMERGNLEVSVLSMGRAD